jgi:secreted PhoX family phosphatase
MNPTKIINEHFQTLLQTRLSRREVLRMGGCVGAVTFLGSAIYEVSAAGSPLMGFTNVAASSADEVALPPGYSYRVLISWGDPIHADTPAFARDADDETQAKQFGDNTDGMELFSRVGKNGETLVLAINNEYYNPQYFYPHGGPAQNLTDVRKAQHAHGVTLVELSAGTQGWQVKQDSPLNRRIHGNTECAITGPAAGAEALKTSRDPSGHKAWGTLNNCGAGRTPWGTYLTCEENFNHYFGSNTSVPISDTQHRYGIAQQGVYGWWHHDPRFDLSREPNEPNRFGWVVEIDPFDPTATPKKRTALGRFKHENAETALAPDGRVVVYMGDDEADEFLYKFVSHNAYHPGAAGNADLLDHGILYTARFNDDGTGEWLPLLFNNPGLTVKDGFKDQADVLVRARQAASSLGATPMDRPEWVACHPSAPLVFCTLSNNAGRAETNKPNPRKNNIYGQIVRWWPDNLDHAATGFQWDLYVLAGNPTVHKKARAGSANIHAENMFNSPDGLAIDGFGRLWIQTDGNTSNTGDFAGHGNNQMLCGDPVTGEIRRFLVGPIGCEITGQIFSADHRTMMVGIQHPTGKWPNAKRDGVPRSSVIVIFRDDGGIIGAA